MIILRTDEQVPLKIGELTVWVSPLSWAEKTSLYKHHTMKGGEVMVDENAVLRETIRFSVKKVDGFDGKHQFSDGSPAVLPWEDGKLTDEGLEMLVQVLGFAPASNLSSALLTDRVSQGVEGFEMDLSKSEPKKK